MVVSIKSVSSHQAPLRGSHSVRSAALNHYIFKPSSFSQPRHFACHYSTGMSKKEQRKIVRIITEQQDRAQFLPRPGTPEYQQLREEIGVLIKNRGKNPSIALISIDEGLKRSTDEISRASEKVPEEPFVTKKDILEMQIELRNGIRKIENILEELRVEISRGSAREDNVLHNYSSK